MTALSATSVAASSTTLNPWHRQALHEQGLSEEMISSIDHEVTRAGLANSPTMMESVMLQREVPWWWQQGA